MLVRISRNPERQSTLQLLVISCALIIMLRVLSFGNSIVGVLRQTQLELSRAHALHANAAYSIYAIFLAALICTLRSSVLTIFTYRLLWTIVCMNRKHMACSDNDRQTHACLG